MNDLQKRIESALNTFCDISQDRMDSIIESLNVSDYVKVDDVETMQNAAMDLLCTLWLKENDWYDEKNELKNGAPIATALREARHSGNVPHVKNFLNKRFKPIIKSDYVKKEDVPIETISRLIIYASMLLKNYDDEGEPVLIKRMLRAQNDVESTKAWLNNL